MPGRAVTLVLLMQSDKPLETEAVTRIIFFYMRTGKKVKMDQLGTILLACS